MNQDINRELLFLYWTGQATPMQRKLIVSWLQDPAHQETFYQWLVDWEERYPQAIADAERAWGLLNNRVDGGQPIQTPQTDLSSQPRQLWRGGFAWWMMAASVILVALAGYLFRDALLWNTYRTGNGQVATVSLPDGSRVSLNANSELRVPKLFLPYTDRSVQLTGEADFSVKHRPDDRRFIVHTFSKVDVVVLGTEFIVTARSRRFRVALHTGKVSLQQRTGHFRPALMLKPGDVVSMVPGRNLQLATNQPTRQLADWKKHLFVFDHHSLDEVLIMLNEQFGESIKLENDSLATHQITGRFRAERAEDLLTVITELTGYRLVIRDNQKYLTN